MAHTDDIRRGDATLVASISQARGLNDGKGFTRDYVSEVLNGTRNNADISAIHSEVVAMRTPAKRRKRA